MASSKLKAWRIGILAPAIIFAAGLSDALLRLVPVEKLAFRTWEPALLYTAGETAFRPHSQISVPGAYGDLANLGHRRKPRESHDETFTTDNLGFRNHPNLLSKSNPQILLFGSSFSVGAGVTDRDVLAPQLSRRLDLSVYNAAAPGGSCQIGLIRALTKRLNLKSGIVLLEVLEREDSPFGPTKAIAAGLQRTESDDLSPVNVATAWNLDHPETSRLEILCRRMRIASRDTWFLPRSEEVVCRTLLNGDDMLFLSEHMNLSKVRRNLARSVGHWTAVVEAINSDNMRAILFLVPEKYTVYGPLVSGSSTNPPLSRSYLGQLEDRLTARGISVVNLEPVFLKRSREDFERHKYLYRRDDTHWGPYGISVAADAIAPMVEAALVSVSQTASN